MKNLTQTFGLVITFVILFFEVNYAQSNKSNVQEKYYWVNLGLGYMRLLI